MEGINSLRWHSWARFSGLDGRGVLVRWRFGGLVGLCLGIISLMTRGVGFGLPGYVVSGISAKAIQRDDAMYSGPVPQLKSTIMYE